MYKLLQVTFNERFVYFQYIGFPSHLLKFTRFHFQRDITVSFASYKIDYFQVMSSFDQTQLV